MNRTYWEKIAPGYNDEIFDVLQNDVKGIITSSLKMVASPRKTVIDVGCAVGKWLPLLSSVFRRVIAADISAKNLLIAKNTYPQHDNIEYLRLDMSKNNTQLSKYDVALCVNAMLTDSLKKRKIFLHNLASCIKRKGYLILVVPSLESWLLTRIIQRQWSIDKALFKEKISGEEAIRRYKNIQVGNAEIDSVITKHYLRDELFLLLSKEGFIVRECHKIEYNWRTEFIRPPAWLMEPQPWDWMLLAQKS